MLDRGKFEFFRRQAGGVVGQTAVTAAALARAEATLEAAQCAGLARVRWEEEPHPDLSYIAMDSTDPRELRAAMAHQEAIQDGAIAVMVCLLQTRRHTLHRWDTVETLGGIEINVEAAHDPYMRVVQAELALEASATLSTLPVALPPV